MDTGANLSIIIPNHNEPNIAWTYIYCRYFYPDSQIIIVNDDKGQGKGWAVREGLKQATKEWIVFLDGDMDIHPREIKKLLKVKSDIVIGKKGIHGFGTRQIISRITRIIIKYLFRLHVTDTQTGVKLFHRKCLDLWNTKGYLFDVEILARAIKRKFEIREVDIITSEPTKRKGLFVLIKSIWELIILWFRLLFQ